MFSNGSKAGDDFMALYAKASEDFEKNEKAWIQMLREKGIVASHPDDGWVDRKENTAQMVYPHFNDGIEIGSLIALGRVDKWRVVRVVDIIQSELFKETKRYKFVDVEEENELKKHSEVVNPSVVTKLIEHFFSK